jgi:hypothetical protein
VQYLLAEPSILKSEDLAIEKQKKNPKEIRNRSGARGQEQQQKAIEQRFKKRRVARNEERKTKKRGGGETLERNWASTRTVRSVDVPR